MEGRDQKKVLFQTFESNLTDINVYKLRTHAFQPISMSKSRKSLHSQVVLLFLLQYPSPFSLSPAGRSSFRYPFPFHQFFHSRAGWHPQSEQPKNEDKKIKRIEQRKTHGSAGIGTLEHRDDEQENEDSLIIAPTPKSSNFSLRKGRSTKHE